MFATQSPRRQCIQTVLWYCQSGGSMVFGNDQVHVLRLLTSKVRYALDHSQRVKIALIEYSLI